MYKQGDAVILEMEFTPLFGVIYDLIVFEVNNYYLVCEELITEYFNPHFHSFRVVNIQPKSVVICRPSDLVDHTVLGIYSHLSSFHYYEVLCCRMVVIIISYH